MRQRWPRWMCCHPSRIHGETLGTPTSDQHANVGSCLLARECRRNDASNLRGEWLVASYQCSLHFLLWHDQRFHWRNAQVACFVLLHDDLLLSLPGDLVCSIQEARLSSWRCEYVRFCSVSGFPIATDRLPLGGTTETQMAWGPEGHQRYIRNEEHLMKCHQVRWFQNGAGLKTRMPDLDRLLGDDQKRPKRGCAAQRREAGDDGGSLVRRENRCQHNQSPAWSWWMLKPKLFMLRKASATTAKYQGEKKKRKDVITPTISKQCASEFVFDRFTGACCGWGVLCGNSAAWCMVGSDSRTGEVHWGIRFPFPDPQHNVGDVHEVGQIGGSRSSKRMCRPWYLANEDPKTCVRWSNPRCSECAGWCSRAVFPP